MNYAYSVMGSNKFYPQLKQQLCQHAGDR